MTYKETIDMIREHAEAHPAVGTFYYGNVLRINEERNWCYPVVVLSPRTSVPVGDMMRFGFVLWYIDILSKGRREYSVIQSDGITTLTEIGIRINDDDRVAAVNNPLSVFNERFNDICAGAVCDLDVTTPAIICADY